MASGSRRGSYIQFAVRRQFTDWCVWQFGLPAGALVLSWIHGTVADVDHPFVRAASSGSVLLFAGLLLITASVELRKAQLLSTPVRLDRRIDHQASVAMLLGIFLLMLVGPLEIHMMSYDFHSDLVLPSKFLWSASSCVAAALLSGFFALMANYSVMDAQLKAMGI